MNIKVEGRLQWTVENPPKCLFVLCMENAEYIYVFLLSTNHRPMLLPVRFTVIGLPNIPKAKDISIEVYFDDKLMCYVVQPLGSSELWK